MICQDPIRCIALLLMLLLTMPCCTMAQESEFASSGQFEANGPWQLTIELEDSEFKALEPVVPQDPAFGGAFPAPRIPDRSDREFVANLLGTRFPWVRASLKAEASSSAESFDCRLRYDGDFTYMMSAGGPKRPMFVELLDGKSIQGATAFRLHSMVFDATLMRELSATHVFADLEVPVPRSTHAEVTFAVRGSPSQKLGLYTALEVVDAALLKRSQISEESLILQINGLSSLQYVGDEWTAYAPLFRGARPPSRAQQERIIAFVKLISESSEEEFASRIVEYINVEGLLRYVAANTLTSNLTGLATIGVNDFLCLDPDGKLHLVASDLEISMGGSVLCGTSEQLANLSIIHPYAGNCLLLDRMMKIGKFKEDYLQIFRDATNSALSDASINATMDFFETTTAEAREREVKAAAERAAPNAFGGFGPGQGGPATPAIMTVRSFLSKRRESVLKQLEGSGQEFRPSTPNFGGGGGGGFGPPSRQDAKAPITEREFSEAVQVPIEFKATLFARSPEVNYPVAIAAEPAGAIYVASDEQGSLGTDRNGGKVLRCIDRDMDGVMDSVTTYCRVDHVRGVVYRNGAVWVCHPPFLSVFHDDDGDGVADRNQQLVSGLTTDLVNTRGGDHTTNCIRMGIDGWLYIGDGDYGVAEAKGIDGSTVSLRGGGILRVRPDGTELELFSSGLRNPFDVAIDPQLNMFTRDNTNDGGGWDTRVSHLYQSAEYGYPRLFANFSDEIMPTLGAFGNGGGTGSLYVEDSAWPAKYNKSLFTGDWGRSAVFHHPLIVDGPAFKLTQESFATVPRATGMDIDAKGNLYVASWWSGEASVYVGPQVGFVTRISPLNGRHREFPALDKASLSDLIDMLRVERAVVRFHAQGELISRADAATVAALSRVVEDGQFPLNGRIAAMFAVYQIDGVKSQGLLLSMTKDPAMREFAVRALTDRKSQMGELKASELVPFLADPSPRVVAQTLIALGRLGDVSVADLVIPLAIQPGDSRPDPALPNSAQVIPHLALRTLIELNAVDACLKALDSTESLHRQASLRALRATHDPKAVDGLIARLLIERNTDTRTEILVTLIRLYQQETPYDGSWWGIRPDTTGPYFDPMIWAGSERIGKVLTTAIQESDADTAAILRSELRRHQVELPGISNVTEATVAMEANPIVIEPADPSNPDQLGNMPFDQALARTMAIPGNSDAGMAVFKARSCTACHTSVAGQKPIGPHLVDIGKRYKSNELLESILKPSQKIAQGYETQLIVLTTGRTLSGFVIGENGRRILLRDSHGVTHEVLRDEIEDRTRQQISAMPEGLAASLEPKQLADLIAYLQSL